MATEYVSTNRLVANFVKGVAILSNTLPMFPEMNKQSTGSMIKDELLELIKLTTLDKKNGHLTYCDHKAQLLKDTFISKGVYVRIKKRANPKASDTELTEDIWLSSFKIEIALEIVDLLYVIYCNSEKNEEGQYVVTDSAKLTTIERQKLIIKDAIRRMKASNED